MSKAYLLDRRNVVSRSKDSLGFTVIELLISISIISLISGVIFFNFPKLNQDVLLNRAARELTLALREAQSRAVAVTPLPGAAPGVFPSNYGVAVRLNSSEFILFSDGGDGSSPNYRYDETSTPGECTGECVKRFQYQRGIKITNIDYPSTTCSPDCGDMHILFFRPDPRMSITNAPASYCSGKCESPAPADSGEFGPFKIFVSQPSSANVINSRKVEIWLTGQISIK
jgi:prepilin-type N-terminal cleavage/methylation domain-containing protein